MEELRRLLTPAVYRDNPFRLLNIPASAGAREIQRREARRQMEAKLGLAAEQTGNSLLALTPAPDDEQIKRALERLHSPADRYLAEFFWFWPSGETPDLALVALEKNQVDDATKRWTQDLVAKDQRITARHNLAILCHLLALDEEAKLASDAANRECSAGVQTLWQRAMDHWHDLYSDPEFWTAATARAIALNDVKLSADVVRRMAEALPAGLLRINARLALAAAERSDTSGTQRHIRLLGASRFDSAAQREAIRSALEPWEDRIKQAIETAKANWTRTPQKGNQHVRTLHAACQQLLSVVDAVLADETDRKKKIRSNPYAALRDGLHDMVAEAMLEGQIAFARKTDDWLDGVKLLELAEKIVAGDALRSRLRRNIDILRENAESGNDWCAPGYWNLPEPTVAIFEAARERTAQGDFDGALASLLPLDASIGGRPLRRAVAYCLSVSAIRSINSAASESGGQQNVLRRLVTAALEKMLLADEVDPGDAGVVRNLQELKKLAHRLQCAIPGTMAIRTRLDPAGDQETTTPFALPSDPADAVCYFCRTKSPSPGCEISVAVCGDVRTTQRLFSRSTNMKLARVSVPRCQHCYDAHRAIRRRQAHWEKQRESVTHAVARPRGIAARLGRGASSLGAGICLVVGFAARDGRAGFDLSPLATKIAAGTHASDELIDRVLAPALGLLAGLMVTAWLIAAARRSRARDAARIVSEQHRFATEHPEPVLPAGIRPEDTYLQFPKLKDLRAQKWSFGHMYQPDRADPIDVKGLSPAEL